VGRKRNRSIQRHLLPDPSRDHIDVTWTILNVRRRSRKDWIAQPGRPSGLDKLAMDVAGFTMKPYRERGTYQLHFEVLGPCA
jgi:hypothetical protein